MRGRGKVAVRDATRTPRRGAPWAWARALRAGGCALLASAGLACGDAPVEGPVDGPTPGGVHADGAPEEPRVLEGLGWSVLAPAPGARALDVDAAGRTWLLTEAEGGVRVVPLEPDGEASGAGRAVPGTRALDLLVLDDGAWVVTDAGLFHVPLPGRPEGAGPPVPGGPVAPRGLALGPAGELHLLDGADVFTWRPGSEACELTAGAPEESGRDRGVPRGLAVDSYGQVLLVRGPGPGPASGADGGRADGAPVDGGARSAAPTVSLAGPPRPATSATQALPAPLGCAVFEAGVEDPLADLDGALLVADPDRHALVAHLPVRAGAGWRFEPVTLLSGAACAPRDVVVDAGGELRALVDLGGARHAVRLFAAGVEPLPPLDLDAPGPEDAPHAPRLDGLACAHPGTRAAALARLARLPDAAEHELLRRFSAHPRPRVAVRSLWTLVDLPGGATFARQFLHRHVPELRAAGLRALTRGGAADADDVARAVADEDPLVRAAAADALAGLNAVAALPLVLTLARGTEPADPVAVRALRRALGEDPAVREACAAVLADEGRDVDALLGPDPGDR